MIWSVLRRLVADKIFSRLGGRLRLAISGGAPLSPKLSVCFILNPAVTNSLRSDFG